MTKRKITHQGCGRQWGRPEPSFEALSRPLLGGEGALSFGGFAIILCGSRPTSTLRRVVLPLCRIAPTCEEDASARSEAVLRQNRRGTPQGGSHNALQLSCAVH